MKLSEAIAQMNAAAEAGDMETVRALTDRINAKGYGHRIPDHLVFVPQDAATPDTFGQDALDVAGEGAAAFNRGLMQGLDFVGPGTINAGLRLAGSDYQLPTFSGAHAQTPGAQGQFMDEGWQRNAVQGAGAAGTAALGMMPVARNLASPIQAGLEFFGFGAAKPQAAVAPIMQAGVPAQLTAPQSTTIGELIPRTQARQNLDSLVSQGSDSVDRLGYRYDPYSGRAIPEPAAGDAVKQGIEEGLVSMVQSSNPATKQKMSRMVDIVDQGRKSLKFRNENRPLDVVGEAVTKRVNAVDNVRRQAGAELDTVAEGLKGQRVTESSAGNRFNELLQKAGVTLSRDEEGKAVLDFAGSDFEDLRGTERILQRIVDRIDKTDTSDAYKLHQLKRYLDEQVSYDKVRKGMTRRTEDIIKTLRRDIDELLDDTFPEYNRVNTVYSETREAMDALQKASGPNVPIDDEFADRSLGTLSRRVLSNARSGTNVEKALKNIDQVAKRYAAPSQQALVPQGGVGRLGIDESFDDDLLELLYFADNLDTKFKTNAGMSLKGELEKVRDRGLDDMATNSATMTGMLSQAGKSSLDWARGINEDNAIQALRDLLGNR